MKETNFLNELADRHAITEMIYRYCRSVDRLDRELGYSIWHDDAVADYGERIYRGSGRGVIDHICEQHKQALDHSHQITNITITLDGDSAGSESYVISATRIKKNDKILQVGFWGRYLDKWSRRNGRWGIEKRITVCDFDELREVTPLSQAGLDSRDSDDPSYEVLSPQG